jgi:hypothetical protein
MNIVIEIALLPWPILLPWEADANPEAEIEPFSSIDFSEKKRYTASLNPQMQSVIILSPDKTRAISIPLGLLIGYGRTTDILPSH